VRFAVKLTNGMVHGMHEGDALSPLPIPIPISSCKAARAGPVSQALLEFHEILLRQAYLALAWRLLGGIERSIF
jgi:hypothetical protein